MANCFGLRTARLGAACPHGRPRPHFKKSLLRALVDIALVALAESCPINNPIHCADEAGTANDVAERDRYKIVNDARLSFANVSSRPPQC
jgi:hypothetical protein